MATAGHCFSSSWPRWYEGGNSNYYIGQNFGYSDYSGMDADVMLFTQSVSTPKNIIYRRSVPRMSPHWYPGQ